MTDVSQTFGTFCSDFYVNQKMVLSMDLPKLQESSSELFDRIRREIPEFERIRSFEQEVSLETSEFEGRYQWVGLRPRSISSGVVNPTHVEKAYDLHRLILELAPYYLSLSPLQIECIELVFGFDLPARENRNDVVMQSLFGNSPLATLADDGIEQLIDVHIGVNLRLHDAVAPRLPLQVELPAAADDDRFAGVIAIGDRRLGRA